MISNMTSSTYEEHIWVGKWLVHISTECKIYAVTTSVWLSHPISTDFPSIHHYLPFLHVKCWMRIFSFISCPCSRIVWLRPTPLQTHVYIGIIELIWVHLSSFHIPWPSPRVQLLTQVFSLDKCLAPRIVWLGTNATTRYWKLWFLLYHVLVGAFPYIRAQQTHTAVTHMRQLEVKSSQDVG